MDETNQPSVYLLSKPTSLKTTGWGLSWFELVGAKKLDKRKTDKE